jgi:benzoyl-CoA reductase subunit C
VSALETLVARCERIALDLDFNEVRRWKEAHGAPAVGHLPLYVPREVLHAAGVLPVGIVGADERLEIVRGDACFQSYICHLPRSVMELALSGRLDVLDGMLFPSTCDVIRNLSGVWRLEFPDRYVRYLDLPQDFDPASGGRFYRRMLEELYDDMRCLSGSRAGDGELRRSIEVYDACRRLVGELDELRAQEPWRVPASEAYVVLRAGLVVPVEEHCRLLRLYLEAVRQEERVERDNARVILTGAFCEQPPLALIRTLERAGCYLVGDDFLPVLRWLGPEVGRGGDPLEDLTRAFLNHRDESATRFLPDGRARGARLVEEAGRCGAEGVLFAAPSFCDPALLERPMLQAVLAESGIAYTSFKYAENTGQLQPIREQAGTFADTLKLWGER